MKPRLMHLVLSLGTGGTERLVIELSKSLRDKMLVSVCCLDEPGEWAEELLEAGMEVVSLHRQPGFHPGLATRIAKLAKIRQIDVLHCHQYSPFVYGVLASLLQRKVRLVYTEHGRHSDALPSRKRRLANLLLSRIPGSFVAVSAELRDYMVAEGFSARRVEVIHNGIEAGPRVTEEDRRSARKALGLDHEALVLGTVARLDPVKNLGTLVSAFSQVSETLPRLALVVIGDGEERHRLEAAIEECGLRNRTIFTGMRDDARTLMRAFDVYVNTSITEGISVTILEAMAASLAVVATRVGGNPEVVEDGTTGALIPARDPEALASAIRELVAASPKRRCQLGKMGRQRAEEEFSLNRMTEMYLDRYRGKLPTPESR